MSSFDVNVLSTKPIIREAASMNNDGGASNLGYMAQGEKKKEEKKHLQDESIFCKKEEVDTFGYSKLDNMPEYEGFSIAKIFAEIIHSIQSLFTQK